jgi:hypothetical protein
MVMLTARVSPVEAPGMRAFMLAVSSSLITMYILDMSLHPWTNSWPCIHLSIVSVFKLMLVMAVME